MIYVKFNQHRSETCNGRDVTLFTLDHEDSGLKCLSNCAILVLVISFSQLTICLRSTVIGGGFFTEQNVRWPKSVMTNFVARHILSRHASLPTFYQR